MRIRNGILAILKFTFFAKYGKSRGYFEIFESSRSHYNGQKSFFFAKYAISRGYCDIFESCWIQHNGLKLDRGPRVGFLFRGILKFKKIPRSWDFFRGTFDVFEN